MIPREHILFGLLLTATLINLGQSQNSKSYDDNDWIPLTNKCPTCYQDDQEEEHTIEKKATDRVLNIAESERRRNNFFPEEQSYRTKKSNKPVVEQYLREVSPPIKKVPKRQQFITAEQSLDAQGLPSDIRQQLNQGEYVNHQYFRQAPPPPPRPLPPPNREYSKDPQPLASQQIQQPQLVPQQLLPQGQQYFSAGGQQFVPPQPLFDIPLPPGLSGVNVYQNNYQNVAANPPLPPPLTKTKTFEALNPGIQAINQGLSGDILTSSNNNYKDFRQISLTSTSPKPELEKETVQLVYVPLESLNQQQAAQIQKQQNAFIQPNQESQKQREVEYQQEQQRIALEQQQRNALQEQQRKALQEQQRKALEEQQRKALEEQQRKALQEQRLREQQEAIRVQQELEAKAEEQKLRGEQEAILRRKQEEEQQLQAILLQQQQQQIRLKPVRPLYQTRVSGFPTETPLEHKQQQLQSIQNDFAKQALAAFNLQLQLQQGPEPIASPLQVTTTTIQTPTVTPTPKKRKPHQPPLAVYMEANGDVSVSDVLNILKSAKSISVRDSAGPNSPQVFVGPYNLEPPEGYAKFDLPYLSSLESNRVERKVDQLPFFVAPLSYKTPDGYSKIPLPAPHVGSVVVSQKEQTHEKHVRQQPEFKLENLLNEEPFRLPNQQSFQFEPQPRPIAPFRLEEAINQPPYRLPSHLPSQPVIDPFTGQLTNAAPAGVAVTSRPDLLGQTINEYELEQINSQLLPQNQGQPQAEAQPLSEDGSLTEYEEANVRQPQSRKNHRVVSTTPAPTPSHVQFVTDAPVEVQTTTRQTEIRSRRPTSRTRGSTQSNVDKSKYTVLEEFSVKRRPTATTSRIDYEEVSSTPATNPRAYSANLQLEPQTEQPQRVAHDLPDSTSRLSPQAVSPSVAHQTLQQAYNPTLQQQILNQESPDKQILQQPVPLSNVPTGPAVAPQYYQLDNSGQFVPIQNLDHNAYRLINRQAFEQEVEAFRSGALSSTPATIAQPLLESTTAATTTVKLTEPPVEVTTTGRSRSRSNSRSRSRGKSHYVPESYDEDPVTAKQESAENYKLPNQLPSIHPGLHTLINDLQDQAIRPLLVPASIAPTTEHQALHQLHRQQETEQQPLQSQIHQPHQQQILEQPQILQQQQPQILQQQPQIIQQQQPQIFQQPQPQLIQRQQIIEQPPQILQQQQPQVHQQQHVLEQQQPQIDQQYIQQQEPRLIQQQIIQEQPIYRQSQLQNYQQQQQILLEPSTETAPVITTPSPAPITYTSTTTAAPIETTTPYRRQRGRQRARVSSTTSTPRRTAAQRTRKPTSRTRTDQNRYQADSDYADYTPARTIESYNREVTPRQENDYVTDAPRRAPSRQRTRSRGRPLQELTERTSASASEETTYKQQIAQPEVQAPSAARLPPQSYMQFEQPLQILSQSQAERELVLKQYQPVYKDEEAPLSSTEALPLSFKEPSTDPPKLSVDVLINHPITENVVKEPLVISQPQNNIAYGRFSSNLEPSVRVQQQQIEPEEIATTRAPRIRTRGRGRARPKPTTPRPTTTTVNHVKTTAKQTEEEEEEEAYGFIRPPNYNRPPSVQHLSKQPDEEPKLYSATYLSSTGKPLQPKYDDQPIENSNNVQIYSKNALPSSTPRLQFVGKIRPKYPAKTEEPLEITTEPVTITTEKRYTARTKPTFNPKPRIRNRLRPPTRKPYGEGTTTSAPTRTQKPQPETHRFKPRGVSHYQLPETLQKQKSEDEDVEGGNYPATFLQAQEIQTEKPTFQITIDPGLEENLSDDDQVPYSSIYRPKIVPVNDEEPKLVAVQNDIPIDRKVVESQELPSALPVVSATESEPEASKSNEDKNESEIKKVILDEMFGDAEVSNEEIENASSKSTVSGNDEDEYSLTTTDRPKGRRRGIWRLVKRPVDTFETAESQYVGSIIAANSFSFDGSKKGSADFQGKGSAEEKSKLAPSHHETSSSTTEPSSTESSEVSSAASISSSGTTENFFDSLYKMFGISEEDRAEPETPKNVEDAAVPQDFVEVTTNQEEPIATIQSSSPLPIEKSELQDNVSTNTTNESLQNVVTEVPNLQTDTSVSPQVSSQIPENLQPELDPWDLSLVKTSTSTEISHETEICYRGKCVKSSGTKIPQLV